LVITDFLTSFRLCPLRRPFVTAFKYVRSRHNVLLNPRGLVHIGQRRTRIKTVYNTILKSIVDDPGKVGVQKSLGKKTKCVKN